MPSRKLPPIFRPFRILLMATGVAALVHFIYDTTQPARLEGGPLSIQLYLQIAAVLAAATVFALLNLEDQPRTAVLASVLHGLGWAYLAGWDHLAGVLGGGAASWLDLVATLVGAFLNPVVAGLALYFLVRWPQEMGEAL